MGEIPVVVHMCDLVTGAIAVVPAEEIPTVLDEWFPNVTPRARSVIESLGVRARSGDWIRVDEYGHYLDVTVYPLT